jgi:hypothetical protein
MVDLIALARGAEATEPVADDEPVDASPDELLLELMDLVALSFPTSLYEQTIRFVPNEDGKRPALTDLDGKAHTDAVKRPNLGHTDSEVLDFINHLLGQLAEATFRQGGVRVLRGHITVKDNEHGGRDVNLFDDESGSPELVMTRVFDRSELRWLFFTAEFFKALNDTETRELEQQQALDALLVGVRRFDIDMKSSTITFTGPQREPLRFAFELVGSWLEERRRFLWGWANHNVDPKMSRRVDLIRQRATGHGQRALSEATWGGPEALFLRLARHAAARIGGAAVYRAPFASQSGKGVMFLALFPA